MADNKQPPTPPVILDDDLPEGFDPEELDADEAEEGTDD